MKVALVGIGNVGSGLLYFLAANPHLDAVFVMSRSEKKSRAAIMDVASARPHGAAKLVPSPYTQMSEADVVVLTAGATPEAVPDRTELYRLNCTIAQEILNQSELSPSTILVLLATPVDDVTAFAQRKTGLPANQVLGFGGDLDRNRLASVLLSRGQPAEGIHIVGEHGRNAIPVYPGEADYDEVAAQVRRYLATIIELAAPPRNLATSVLLDELVTSIATDARRIHHVCGYHGELRVFLTWPFTVGRKGLIVPQTVHLEKRAQADLDKLLEERRYRDEMLGYSGPDAA
jgi:malate/lactate dehydrogenase